jgi:hypothetical protein
MKFTSPPIGSVQFIITETIDSYNKQLECPMPAGPDQALEATGDTWFEPVPGIEVLAD